MQLSTAQGARDEVHTQQDGHTINLAASAYNTGTGTIHLLYIHNLAGIFSICGNGIERFAKMTVACIQRYFLVVAETAKPQYCCDQLERAFLQNKRGQCKSLGILFYRDCSP